MKHVLFKEADSYPIAILVKDSALQKPKLENHYVKPLMAMGIPEQDMIAFSLDYAGKKKPTVAICRKYLQTLMPALESLQTKLLYVADANYFKLLTGLKKADAYYGYKKPCVIEGYEHMEIVLGTNFGMLFFKPEMQQKLDMSLNVVSTVYDGTYQELGVDIIHSEYYPDNVWDIKGSLALLHQFPELTVDIEAFSLEFHKAGIGSISFAHDEHNGIAFCCDYEGEGYDAQGEPYVKGDGSYGKQIDNIEVKKLLREFFEEYEGKLTYQNGNYDIKVLIYELFMDNLLDQEGLLEGLEVMTKSIDDTKLITYLATNSTSGNSLGLKGNAHEYAGNYAEEEIKDIRRIPEKNLLRYNLVDCLSTWFVKKKNWPIMVADNQLEIYNTIKIPSVKVILQVELTGMCLNMDNVITASAELNKIKDTHLDAITNSTVAQKFLKLIRQEEFIKQNLLWKKKTAPLEYFDYVEFNPNSDPQVRHLLYDWLKFEPIDFTKGKRPATGAKTLEKLIHTAKCPEDVELLEALIGLGEVSIILNTFIAAMLDKSVMKDDGHYYLHGSFNIGGTVSGRLSSSNPNLQNIPSSSKYAKLIKDCFCAPPGWLMVGADFNSLEDYVSALTTKDPNKLKVYTDGYDGHALRAYKYWPEKFPDIVDTVESINSIKKLYGAIRGDSKPITFMLTYGGTYHGLIQNLGFEKQYAIDVESAYHVMYAVSDQWVADKLKQATIDGYVTAAFGLRVRTPILAQTILGNKATPYEASAEGRTAGNALGQSYCMLNNRAGIEFQQRSLASDYAKDIRPSAHIHDAQYFLIRDNLGCVKWVNDNLVECMQWQELPELKHDTVKLGGELDVFYPTWRHDITIPNTQSIAQIKTICDKEMKKRNA
jgi:DNA polymerase-1